MQWDNVRNVKNQTDSWVRENFKVNNKRFGAYEVRENKESKCETAVWKQKGKY